MTLIPDETAKEAIRRCRCLVELASLTIWWRANDQTISPKAKRALEIRRRTLRQISERR